MSNTQHTTVNIPGAFIEMMSAAGHQVPTEEEIRLVGKGKQYEVRVDETFADFIRLADSCLSEQHQGTREFHAAVAMLRAVKAQGIKVQLTHELPAANVRRWVWIKTDALVPDDCGKYRGRKLLLGVDRHTGTLAIRIAGTQRVYNADLANVFAGLVFAEMSRAIREKRAAKKAKLAQRRAMRKAA